MAYQDELLTELKEWLYNQGNLPQSANDDTAAALHRAYANIYNRLARALAAPTQDDNTADMSVTVVWPLCRGEMQSVVFDRDGGPEPETLTNSDRVILRTMLELALAQVPAPEFGKTGS